jgi:chromosome segregation ATPase
MPGVSRGILTTRREIKELRDRVETEGATVERLRNETASLDMSIAALESAILSLQGEVHRLEKSSVGFDLQVAAGAESIERIRRKHDQIATERRSAEEELRVQDARQEEARESIARIQSEQLTADDQLNAAQRRLFEAREAMQTQAARTSEAKASHAALVERSSALATEVQRLENLLGSWLSESRRAGRIGSERNRAGRYWLNRSRPRSRLWMPGCGRSTSCAISCEWPMKHLSR